MVPDAFGKQVVGRNMGESATADLVANAVEMAITRRNPAIAPVHHSDRGTQGGFYRSSQSAVGGAYGASEGLGSRGDAYDNAVIESSHPKQSKTRG